MLNQALSFITQNSDIIKISLAILLGVVVSFIEYLLYKYSLPKLSNSSHHWRCILVKALHGPLQAYVWVIAISMVLEIVSNQVGFNGRFVDLISPARRVITLLFFLWFIMRVVSSWELQFVKKINNGGKKVFRDVTSVNAVAQLLRVLAILVVLLMVLSSLGISISALLTAGGIGGLALSFAARDTLANFIGGLMIYWDRPFSVGDWIRSPDRNIEGTVLNIGWRLTKIRTFDKRPLYVPNGIFSNISVENPSRMSNRRIKTLVGVRYSDAPKVGVIVSKIKKMLQEHPDIDTSQIWFVNLVEFGPSSLNVLVYTFTKTTVWVQFQAIQQDVFLKIIDIVTGEGAEFAFPSSTIYLPDEVEQLSHLLDQKGSQSNDSRN